MMEMALSLPLLLVVIIFIIDVSVAFVTFHKLNYEVAKCARTASLSEGKTVSSVVRSLRGRLAFSLISELKTGRVKMLNVSIRDDKGRKLKGEKKFRRNEVIRLIVKIRYRFRITPWYLLPSSIVPEKLGSAFSPRETEYEISRITTVE